MEINSLLCVDMADKLNAIPIAGINIDKPFGCVMCSSAFASKSNLKVHLITVHDGIRPYVCRKCSRAFGTKSSLTRHEKIVHEQERRYPCSACSKRFASRSCVKRHLRTHSAPQTSSDSSSRSQSRTRVDMRAIVRQ
mmetsp:Transcript_6416/g.19409  ORF Transcript_6416/g.19409 Transcript_6416/m.19409 type:complete len:137 (+) Transcript_6416:351-761(+)